MSVLKLHTTYMQLLQNFLTIGNLRSVFCISRCIRKLKQLSDSAISAINALPGQALHAKSLGFVHPQKEKIQLFQSVIPDYLSNLINSIKN